MEKEMDKGTQSVNKQKQKQQQGDDGLDRVVASLKEVMGTMNLCGLSTENPRHKAFELIRDTVWSIENSTQAHRIRQILVSEGLFLGEIHRSSLEKAVELLEA